MFQAEADNLPHFIAHSIHGAHTLARVRRSRYGHEDANCRTVILHAPLAFNLDLATVALDKLLCDEQTDACAHGAASGEEGCEHPE